MSCKPLATEKRIGEFAPKQVRWTARVSRRHTGVLVTEVFYSQESSLFGI